MTTAKRKKNEEKTSLNAIRKNTINVRQHIVIHMVTDGISKGWTHTHGMRTLGFPELEIKGIPLFMCAAAGSMLNELADFIVNSGEVFKTGETVALGMTRFRLVLGTPADTEEAGHYEQEVWRLEDIPMQCEACGSEESNAPKAKA